jgi:hypothetical protein
MSSFSIVHDISIELQSQIVLSLKNAPDVDFDVDNGAEKISLVSPGAEIADNTVASLYLYHLDIDKFQRNQRLLPDGSSESGFRRPPLPLQLRYLFTPVDDDEATNHLVLGRVLQHFHDNPEFSTLSGVPIGNSFGGASREVRVRPDMLSLEQLTQMWSAFSAPYRTAVSFLVEVVAIDSGQPPIEIVRTGEVIPATGLLRRLP